MKALAGRDLTSRIALISGGGAGIGRAIALELASRGAAVAILDIDPAAASATASDIAAHGGTASAAICDIADVVLVKRTVAEIARSYGRIDILVNNAGVGGGEKFDDVSVERFDRLFAVNVKGAFFLTQAVAPTMVRQGGGRIVNIASLIGVRGLAGNPHYAGTKAALIGLTRSWAQELAPDGITVNCVVPGMVLSPMTIAAHPKSEIDAKAESIPMRRLGTPEDVAQTVGYLCSPGAAFLTGQVLSPNGAEYVGPM